MRLSEWPPKKHVFKGAFLWSVCLPSFHSISAFCNAGFSTLSNSLYEVGYRMNYGLQLVVASLFIVGGLGFPILFNLVRYLKHLLTHKLLNKRGVSMPWPNIRALENGS